MHPALRYGLFLALRPFVVEYRAMPVHPSARVAATARIAPGAEIAEDVEIGEYVIVEDDVAIGPRTKLEAHVVVKRWTTLGADNQISVGTVLGTDPLDKNFSGERSYLKIGNGNRIREHYTISRGTEPESVTVIGDNNYIMTAGHIAHNCRLGSNIVVCSCALVAGYVEIEDQAFLSGGVGVHQYSKIGRLAMIGGNIRVNKDVAPYFLYSEFNIKPCGLNLVGLRRAGFAAAEIAALKKAYRLLFRENLPLENALRRIAEEAPSEHTDHLVAFIRSSKRGIARR
jgi:UDP-N-acetylglucosamine acyltransferase